MSDSESETRSSNGIPSAKVLEQGLRDTVAKIYKSGKLDELTVKRVRLATEENLGLEQNFFKSHDEWKPRSDEIIKDEVEVQEKTPPKPAPAPKKRQSKKRPSPEAPKAPAPSKRQKRSTVVESEESDISSVTERSEPKPVSKRKAKPIPVKAPKSKKAAKVDTESEQEDSERSDGNEDMEAESGAAPEARNDADAGGASESEMSVLIDEEPKPKRKRSTGKPSAPSKAKKSTSEKKQKDTAPEDPDKEEIKRLQGWLVKCGIRKVWGRELMGCSTPKEKIRHLKSMLKDAGMDGRYSIEKANRIREDRELKADLEAVQEGAKMWGAAAADEEGEGPPKTGRSSRRLAKSFKQFDFLAQKDQDSESD
ncbi:putative Transcriptional regulator [Arthroderma uncinatum]|uniref:putative Transcriptional regulator n=1 Tax=Arthroderma uncinatum TaxID=74035 RepID=UPI00144A7BB7|nr:putative Transcriptional regulator [Arthroderma uncinatum]KAF3492182.1 putative Transcriptional regulator [Arthroderma uncinatum]